MELCRLCGAEKSPQDLVIKLSDKIQDNIYFKEFVEYYCQFVLDSNLCLPQQVCRICRNQVVKFSEFSYLVEKQQEKFDVKPTIVEDEPEVKKVKIDETINNNSDETKLDTVINSEVPTVSDEVPVTNDETKAETENPKPRLRERRKSVFFLQSIESLLTSEKVSWLIASSKCINIYFSSTFRHSGETWKKSRKSSAENRRKSLKCTRKLR